MGSSEESIPSLSDMEDAVMHLIRSGGQTLMDFVRREIITSDNAYTVDPLSHTLLNPKQFTHWLGIQEFVNVGGFGQLTSFLSRGIEILGTNGATTALAAGSCECQGCILACCAQELEKPPAPEALRQCHHKCLLALQLLANLLERVAAGEEGVRGTAGYEIDVDDSFVNMLKSYIKIMIRCESARGTTICMRLMSVVATMQPDVFFSNLSADASFDLTGVLLDALEPPFDQLKADCIVEMFFGLACIMNAIPLLHQMAVVQHRDCSRVTPLISSLLVNIIHHAAHREDDTVLRESFPELITAVSIMDSLTSRTSPDVVAFPTRDSFPFLFGAAAMIELSAFWNYRGYDVTHTKCPASPPDHKLAQMTHQQIASYTESTAEGLHFEYRDSLLEVLSDPQHNLTYLLPTFHFLIGPPPGSVTTDDDGTRVRKPSLRILRLNCIKCTYAQCSQRENLKKCQRCQCAKYCCREHQKLDWPRHKTLCGLMG